MTKPARVCLIVFVLLLELAWAVWPQCYLHGPVLDEPYRNPERRTALFAWLKQPTPATRAAYDAELTLLHKHMMQTAVTILIAGLAVNGAAIFWLWRYEPKKRHASRVSHPA